MSFERYAETVRLITQGANFGIRFIAITQFSSMIDKLLPKMAQQRYIGKTSEPNDLAYLSGIIGKHICELPFLKRGQFLYWHSGEIGKIQIEPLTNSKRGIWLTYKFQSVKVGSSRW